MTFIALRRLVCQAYISQYITASCYHSLASGIVVSRRWLSWLIHANPKRTSTRKCRSALNRNSLSSLSHTANARSVPHRGSSARLFPSGLRNMIHDSFSNATDTILYISDGIGSYFSPPYAYLPSLPNPSLPSQIRLLKLLIPHQIYLPEHFAYKF